VKDNITASRKLRHNLPHEVIVFADDGVVEIILWWEECVSVYNWLQNGEHNNK